MAQEFRPDDSWISPECKHPYQATSEVSQLSTPQQGTERLPTVWPRSPPVMHEEVEPGSEKPKSGMVKGGWVGEEVVMFELEEERATLNTAGGGADTAETVLDNIESAYKNLKEYAVGMQEFQGALKAPDTTFSPNLHMLICRSAVAIWQQSCCHLAAEQLPHGSCAVATKQQSSCHMAAEQLPLGSTAVATWQLRSCHMAAEKFSLGNFAVATWHQSRCHVTMSSYHMKAEQFPFDSRAVGTRQQSSCYMAAQHSRPLQQSSCHTATSQLPHGNFAVATLQQSICHMATAQLYLQELERGRSFRDAEAVATWQQSSCHMAAEQLPHGSKAQSSCHIATALLPHSSRAVALWQLRNCHMAAEQLPSGSEHLPLDSIAVATGSRCHLAASGWHMTIEQVLLAAEQLTWVSVHLETNKLGTLVGCRLYLQELERGRSFRDAEFWVERLMQYVKLWAGKHSPGCSKGLEHPNHPGHFLRLAIARLVRLHPERGLPELLHGVGDPKPEHVPEDVPEPERQQRDGAGTADQTVDMPIEGACGVQFGEPGAAQGGRRRSSRLASQQAAPAPRPAAPTQAAPAPKRKQPVSDVNPDQWYGIDGELLHTMLVCAFPDGEGVGDMYFVPYNSLSKA
ncbi:leucine zipper protein 2 [Haematococcus lacustris]|uniref:Leucine zipper protein 2 n=1 Tax=Haematococcus lacustris TaxID=44745 RepID=A0A699ZN65_HAELA|nr:leucine zipper protein 2 [Haematococcus lacustris]